jgi:hypothetical protein
MPTRSLLPLCALTVALALTALGCRSTASTAAGELPARFPNHSADQIRQQILLGADTLRAFTAKARVSIDAPSRSGQFSATIRQRRGDSLFMSLSPGLGIEAARILVTPDSVFIYDRINQRLRYGSLQEAQSRLPAPLAVGRGFDVLLGFMAPNAGSQWTVSADSTTYRLATPGGRRKLVVDPTRWRATRYTRYAADSTLMEERTFSEFTTFDGVTIPRRIQVRRTDPDVSASVFYREVRLNPGSLSFDLDVRRSAKRIPLQEQAAR